MTQHNNKLQPFIANLISNRGGAPGLRTYGVRITDTDRGTLLATNKTAAEMEESSGTVDGYFNSLYESGVKNIVIQGRRKNGSSWAQDGEPVQVGFGPAETGSQADTAPPTQPAPQAPAFTDVFSSGLKGANDGLLNAQLAQTHHRIVDYDRLVRDNAELKSENREFKKEIEKLKYEALENQFSDKKAESKNDLVQQFLAQAPALMGAFATFKNGAAAPAMQGLGTPPAGLSEVKQAMIETIQINEDTMSEYLYAVATGIGENEAFASEFIELLNKYKLLDHA